MSTIADSLSTDWVDLLRESKGPLIEGLRYKTVFLGETRRDKSPRRWNGKQVTIPIITAPQQGTSMISEAGVLTDPQVLDTEQANITAAIIELAISFSRQAIQQAKADDTSWAQVVPTKMRMAEDVLGRTINEQALGLGTALLAAVNASTAASGAATQAIDVGTTANFYQLYSGRYVSVLVTASGLATAAGSDEVKISAYSESAGTITVNGSFATTTADGVYIHKSYGNALQGVGQAVATTGTFQGINKANVRVWQGTDVTPSSTTDPGMSILAKAERKARQYSGSTPDYYICDPAVLDKYEQGLHAQARWAGDKMKLSSGFVGIEYRGKVLIDDFDMPAATIYGIARDDVTIYTLDDGPDWIDDTGSIMQRFGRKLVTEAWLVWMLDFGFHRCNSFVKIGSMSTAD